MLDIAVVAEAVVGHAAAITAAQIAADPVVVELVVVGARAERHPAGRAWRGGVQFVAEGTVSGDGVVMHVHIFVEQERQLGGAGDGPVGDLGLAYGEAAGEGSGIAEDPVIGDLHVVVPAVEEDAATALRAVGEAHAVDARRVAQEVARVFRAIGRAVGERRANAVRRAVAGAGGRAGRVVLHAFGEDRDGRAFVGTHQRRLLQNFRQIAVQVGVPADQDFQRQGIDRALLRRRASGRCRGAVDADVVAVEAQAEQAVDLLPPRIDLAGRVGVGIDGDRSGADALQPQRLPHQQHFVVAARTDHDQVARGGRVDGGLQGVVGRILAGHIGGRLAADRDRYGVDGLLAVGGGDGQLAALGA